MLTGKQFREAKPGASVYRLCLHGYINNMLQFVLWKECKWLVQFFSGCMPALMTPCDANRNPDYEALVKKASELISIGMSAVIYCGSMGDWPLMKKE